MPSLLQTLDRLDDHHLVERAAAVVGVPREAVTGDHSFVLHAPLELLARAALLPYVQPEARDRARARIALVADRYEESGPARPTPPAAAFSSLSTAADVIRHAAMGGDVEAADRAAAWLGDHACPEQLTRLLGGLFLPALEAAGHANIYLALLARTQPRGLPQQMLRHPIAALTSPTPRRIRLPRTTASRDREDSTDQLLEAISSVPVIGPAPGYGIAALVEHADSNGILERLFDAGGFFHAPRQPPFPLLRFAAQAMLQGPTEHAPYGWTHCLTLAQAPLLMATDGGDSQEATFVAATYLAAHWAALGHGAVNLDHVPERTGLHLTDALHTSPQAAAAAAWYASTSHEVGTTLATAASTNNDAHRVKYTLACLDAAATDPAATRLYLAAAAYLNAWWETAGDPDDPLPELANATAGDADLSAAK